MAVGITTAIYSSATQSTSNTWSLDSIGAATTACGAPTACSVNTTVAEGNVTLSWSGAANGTGNAISSYEIQYSESTNNSTWGSWTALTTVTTTATSGSVSVAPPSTRGSYRRFQVRTRGAAGSTYYSGWKISTNSVRRNTAPTAPTSVTASPATYSNQTVTVSWSGAAGGTSAIKGYQIASRTSTDNSTWSAWTILTTLNLAASSGSYTASPANTPGLYTQYGLWTIDALSVYSGEKTSNSVYCDITACVAPTAFSLSATLSEGAVTLSWSGAANGAGNTISSYEIQYSESSNNSTWGSWTVLSTVSSTATSGSLSVSPSSTRGTYRRYQIRARGTAGTDYYSPWKVSSNTLRKNILATPPTAFTASPAVYVDNQITLAWSGSVAGTSAIKQYVIQQSTSTDNSTWSQWETVVTVVSSATSGTQVVTATSVAGIYTRYRISVTDTLNAISAYVTSNSVKKNSPPATPTLFAPKNGSITYNPTPRILIQLGADPDGQAQTVWIHTADGDWQNSVDNADHFSHGGELEGGTRTIYTPSEFDPGAHSVIILVKDALSQSAEVVRNFTVQPSTFEEIVERETHVKARHITDLRTAINNIRNYYNMAGIYLEL